MNQQICCNTNNVSESVFTDFKLKIHICYPKFPILKK